MYDDEDYMTMDELYDFLNSEDDDDDDDEDIPFDSSPAAGAKAVQARPMGAEELSVSFADIYGYDSVKSAMFRIVDMANNMEKYTRLGVRMPHGIMLYGEPGVGKTMMAKAMIHDMHRPAYVLRKVQADNAFLELIGAVFEAARENAPSVILLDDMDKFSAGHGCTNEFAAVQAGIDSVKDSDVLVVATVNDLDRLPGALCRHGRFDRKIEVTLPGIEDSAVIIGRYLADKRVSKDVSMKTVAKLLDGYTCAALESVLNEAGMYAGFDGKDEIGMEDIVKAVLSDVYSIDAASSIPPEQKTGTAYHEAGHAAAAMLLRPGSVSIASVRGRGKGPEGFVQTLRSSDESCRGFCSGIITALAGRAASEIKFNETDMGASDDIDKAGRMCGSLIEDLCAKGLAYAGQDPRRTSDSTLNASNMQRSRLLEDSYEEAKTLLRANWPLVESIAQALIRKETLICEDLDALYAAYISGSASPDPKAGKVHPGIKKAA